MGTKVCRPGRVNPNLPSFRVKITMTPVRFLKAVLCALLLALGHATSADAGTEHLRSGEIRAIERAHRIVVVEVPAGDQNHTVAGPVSPGAALIRNRKTARLSDFRIGDRVNVEWTVTIQGTSSHASRGRGRNGMLRESPAGGPGTATRSSGPPESTW